MACYRFLENQRLIAETYDYEESIRLRKIHSNAEFYVDGRLVEQAEKTPFDEWFISEYGNNAPQLIYDAARTGWDGALKLALKYTLEDFKHLEVRK